MEGHLEHRYQFIDSLPLYYTFLFKHLLARRIVLNDVWIMLRREHLFSSFQRVPGAKMES